LDAKWVEKWLIRLCVIHLILLIIAQFLMAHRAWTPYLNKAVRYEGVFGTTSKQTESVDEPIGLWYHK